MDRRNLIHGVTLERYIHPGRNPDELGTVNQWNALIQQLHILSPIGANVEGFTLELWHMSHPDLDAERRKGIANLEDYDPGRDGCQVAAGLNWGTSRIEIGQFPFAWRHDVNEYTPIAEGQLNRAMGVLSHELGHRYWHVCGLSDGSQESQALTNLFDVLRPKQGHNIWEDFAECYRAMYGATAGAFSDGREFTPSSALKTLMRFMWDIKSYMTGTITDMRFGHDAGVGDLIYWNETLNQWWWPWPQSVWRGMTHDGKRVVWSSNKWQSA